MVIAYDLGTGGLKATVFREDGSLAASLFHPYKTYFNGLEIQEQRPEDWWEAVVHTTRELTSQNGLRAQDIDCVALSGHSLGVVPVDSRGNLLRERTPIWSDLRAKKQADKFFKNYDYTKWYMTTGNGFPRELYAIFKILWLRDNEPETYRRAYKILGTKDYINFKLTGEYCTDHSYASGSGAYNLAGWRYDEEIIRAAGIERSLLPQVAASSQIIGKLTPEAAGALGLPQSTKVACGGVDNSCMALGAGCIGEGKTYLSFGTSAWIATSGDKPVLDPQKFPYVFAHCVEGQYTSAVSSFTGAAALNWAKDQLCADLVAQAERNGKDIYGRIEARAARSPIGANKLIFNPNLIGGSLFEDSPNIRGGFAGLLMGHTRDDMLRAVMEGVAMNLGVVLELLRSLTAVSAPILLVGGGSKSPLWRRILTDVFGIGTFKTQVGQNAAALGAAALALVGSGAWESYERVEQVHRVEETLEPDEQGAAQYQKLMTVFREVSSYYAKIGDRLAALKL